MHVRDQKSALRVAIKERLDAMTSEQRAAEGRSASRRILEHLPEPCVICAYYPLKTEVDIRLVLTTLLERKDKVYLPVYNNEKMIFRQITSDTTFQKGELNIPEPPTSAPVLGRESVDVILVPGRAFTKQGHRLGRGAGGYDHWIADYRKLHPNTQFWGVCLECQLVNDIPTETHDEQMDAIVTAREFISVEQ